MNREQLSSCSAIERTVSTAAIVLLAYTIHSVTADYTIKIFKKFFFFFLKNNFLF